MILELYPHQGKPIYEQLILEIKRGIVTGQLKPGEDLPSVRTLAADIGINMHTVNKVYKYLQKEDILIKGRNGFQVNPDQTFKPTPETLSAIRELLYEVMLEKELHRLSDQDIADLMASVKDDIHKGGNP